MMRIKSIITVLLLFCLWSLPGQAAYLLLPMDNDQTNHLKAYGIAYWTLDKGNTMEWLLNYRGGSFLIPYVEAIQQECVLRGVRSEIISDASRLQILNEIARPDVNMDVIKMEKAPKIAVYAPADKQPWDDAVIMALDYAEIPFDQIYDGDIIEGKLKNYDWLHLHHEDFTGQHGKFWFGYSHEKWYIERSVLFENIARKLGFNSVQDEKKAVALKIKEFVLSGGFLFAMCAATDTLDIALASLGLDIIPPEIDGSPVDPNANALLNFSNTFAFTGFKLITDPYVYEFSDIDIDPLREGIYYDPFYIKLNEFSAKYDTIASMLVQNHRNLVKGFLGQTTAFQARLIRKDVMVLDAVEGKDWVTYIHGDRGKGTFTFFGGHDPEDYSHKVGDPPTNLDLFPNSPGYRIILNNILFPAAKEKKKKT
ncbi:MAG: asparagine synthetase B [Bacteroidales bacterium]|nr:asparagine synthetase B [Bacteroidales bacterium]